MSCGAGALVASLVTGQPAAIRRYGHSPWRALTAPERQPADRRPRQRPLGYRQARGRARMTTARRRPALPGPRYCHHDRTPPA